MAPPEPHGRAAVPAGGLLALPVRVLVKGASTVNWVSWMGGPRTDLAYPRATEAALLERGRPAVVRDGSMAAAGPSAALRTWQEEVVSWSPDVVVLHYGWMECIHQLLPVPLQRYAQSLRTRPGSVRDRYRAHVVAPAWKGLARAQQRADDVLPATLFTHRPRHVGRDLDLLVSRVRSVGSPLVLVMDLHPPGRTYERWFPGLVERLDVMNEALRGVVARADHPDVRLFPTTEVLTGRTPDQVAPDGAHLAPWAHRAVGQALADVVDRWAADQPHLRTRSPLPRDVPPRAPAPGTFAAPAR